MTGLTTTKKSKGKVSPHSIFLAAEMANSIIALWMAILVAFTKPSPPHTFTKMPRLYLLVHFADQK